MFEGIIGNDKIKEELTQAVKLNKFSHSYIFLGTDGIGKKLIAREFAKMIMCSSNSKYCNKCKSCIEFDSNNNPDFQEIVPEEDKIKIEQIREMQRKIQEAPIVSERKVYIIDDADTATKEAQNALLKTLEEPPEYANIILIGANESNFLNTIKSRCQCIKFQNIPNEKIKEYLEKKCDIYDVPKNLIEASYGSIKKAIKYCENEDLFKNIDKYVSKIENTDLIENIKNADSIYKSQENKYEILDYLNIIFIKKAKENFKYLKCIDIVEETKKRIKANSNYNMCIDNMIITIWEVIH